MDEHVTLQFVSSVECCLAHFTFKGLLPSVNQLVELQRILRLELFGALLGRGRRKDLSNLRQGLTPQTFPAVVMLLYVE